MPTESATVSAGRLKSFIERIEKLEEDRTALGDDLREVFAEVKSQGYDTKTVRQLVKLRKVDIEKRREPDEILEL